MKHVRYVATAVAVLFAGGAWAASTTQDNSRDEDRSITQQVQSELKQENVASSGPIRVQTHNGVVELSGSVQNEGDRKKAYEAARSVPGVTGVQDNLTVMIR